MLSPLSIHPHASTSFQDQCVCYSIGREALASHLLEALASHLLEALASHLLEALASHLLEALEGLEGEAMSRIPRYERIPSSHIRQQWRQSSCSMEYISSN
jgi:hypothetical protein